jgi:hypothetical protein
MPVRCRNCGSTRFRISHFRIFSDTIRLPLLQYPVRCLICRHRDYVFIPRLFQRRREIPARRDEKHTGQHPRGGPTAGQG